jgi:hypothetical protein
MPTCCVEPAPPRLGACISVKSVMCGTPSIVGDTLTNGARHVDALTNVGSAIATGCGARIGACVVLVFVMFGGASATAPGLTTGARIVLAFAIFGGVMPTAITSAVGANEAIALSVAVAV